MKDRRYYAEVLEMVNEVPSELIQKLSSKDDCDRSEAIAGLSQFGDEWVRKLVRERLSDSWEGVRIEAIDYLVLWNDEKSISAIMRCLDDPDELVRNDAACALGSMGVQSVIPIAKGRIADLSVSDLEKQGYYYALHILGEPGYLLAFLNGLFSEDYHVRCSTANTLPSMVNRDNNLFLRNLLHLLRKTEMSRAVVTTYERVLEQLEEEFGDATTTREE